MIIKRWEDHRNLVVGVAFAVTKRKPEKSLAVRDSNTAQGSIPPYKPDFFVQVFFSRLQKLRPQLPWSSLLYGLILHPAVLIYDYHISEAYNPDSGLYPSAYIDYSTCDHVW